MPPDFLPAEAHLLLCCARTRLDEAAQERLGQLIRHDIRWSYMLELALWHRQEPLLHRHLTAYASDQVPVAVLDALRKRALHNTSRSLLLAGELLKIVEAFEAEQIDVIPYKGPVLAAAAFGDLTLRPCYDIDVLVREDSVWPAVNILRALGYRTPHNADGGLPATKSQLVLVHEGHGNVVELHWQLAPPRLAYDFDLDRMWERREPVKLCGRSLRTFGVEDLLVLLVVHGAKHFWRRLHWLASVAELVRARPDIDGQLVHRCADAVGAKRALELGLLLAADLLEMSIPTSLAFRPSAKVHALRKQVIDWLFFAPGDLPADLDPPEPLRRAWFQFGVREHLHHGLRYSLHRLRQIALPSRAQ